jgi:nitrogenase molybdenum-cofactor synthesis protein NifE
VINSNQFYVPIGELEDFISHRQTKVLPLNCLKYASPQPGGWCIVRFQLLVPESIVLFVAPSGCGRHGAIAGIHYGYKKRLFNLQVDERDIVTSRHLERIPLAIEEILSDIKVRPKAIFITASCMDDLLGSDYDSIAKHLEIKYGIPVRVGHMDPIAVGGKTPPQLTVQEVAYDFLQPSKEGPVNAVNIIGSVTNIDKRSEFYQVLAEAGLGTCKHIADCKTFEEFQLMSRSAYNLLIKPAGKLAVEQMKKKLVFNCINNSNMLCSWAGGEDYAQELPCSSLFRKGSSTG